MFYSESCGTYFGLLMAENVPGPLEPHRKRTEESASVPDESVLLYKTAGTTLATSNYDSRVTKMLRSQSKVHALIAEAGNSNEGLLNLLKKYVVYTIRLVSDDENDDINTRRRYSDFESLREVLVKTFPLVVIPPIPPKNYFRLNVMELVLSSSASGAGDIEAGSPESYSYINSTHLNKNKLIEHRKRLLASFLNSCLQISQIRNLEFFAKFLDPNANWADEIKLIYNHLPKLIYQLNPENGLKTDPLYSHLPIPLDHPINMFLRPILSNGKRLSRKAGLFLNGGESSESALDQSPPALASYTSGLDLINRRITENFIGISKDYSELGSVFNAVSMDLSDPPEINTRDNIDRAKLNVIFDKIGQVFDRSYITINSLVSDLETKFSEPLGEAVQYTSVLQSLNKFEARKLKQQELVDAEIKEKKQALQVLQSGQLVADPGGSRFKLPGLKKLSLYVTDMMDQNPELTRKQKLEDVQKRLSTLEKCQKIMVLDISYITDEIGKNVETFHAKQLKELLGILARYNSFLMAWAQKNVDIWEDIRDEIAKL